MARITRSLLGSSLLCLFVGAAGCIETIELLDDGGTSEGAEPTGSDDTAGADDTAGSDDAAGAPPADPTDPALLALVEAHVAARCGAHAECECGVALDETWDCETEVRAYLLEQLAEAASRGMLVDEACFAQLDAFYTDNRCTPRAEHAYELALGLLDCAPFVTDVGPGMPCSLEPTPRMLSTCGPGLECLGRVVDGEIVSACEVLPTLGQPCDGVCAAGLLCDATGDADLEDGLDGTCVAFPGDGEPCILETCADGVYCDVTNGVCEAWETAGQPCDDALDCASGLCRPEGVCSEKPSIACLPREID